MASYLHKDRPVDRSSALAGEFGKRHGYFVTEGREALALALKDLGLKKEDEVVVPSYICDIVPKVVECFATVVYADINPSTLVVDAEEVQNRISEKTKAVIVAHMYGKVNDLGKIYSLCREKNIALIEDCAQSIYSFEGETRAGSLGNYTILSFRFSKELNLLKGGALLSEKPISADLKKNNSFPALVKILIVHLVLRSQRLFFGRMYYYAKEYILNPFFSKTKYDPERTVHELSSFEQELVLAGLKKMPEAVSRKKEVAYLYASELKDIDGIALCELNDNSFVRFNILASNRQALIKLLHRNGIESDKIYSYSMSRECESSTRVSQRIVNLPVHPGISREDVEKITEVIRRWNAQAMT